MADGLLRRWVLPMGLILLAGAGGLLAIAWRHGDPLGDAPRAGGGGLPPPPPPPEPERPFSFIFGGELAGRLGSPPCSQLKQGGLARVASVVEKMTTRSPNNILMDTGDVPCSEGELGELEYETGLGILREAGLAVAAVGERDLLVGLDRWREAKNRAAEGVSVLCANLRDDAGVPLVPAVATFVLGTRRVHVAATLSPSFEPVLRAAGVPVRLLDPAESLRQALGVAGKADMVVLLSHAPAGESRELLRSLPEVRLAITAHAGDEPLLEPEVVDGRLLMAPGTGWQNISAVRFVGRPAGGIDTVDTHNRAVSPKATPSPLVMMRLAELQRRTGEPGFLARSLKERAARRAGGPSFTGPAACASCHPAAHAKWSGGEDPHASSMRNLRRMDQEAIPLCLQCHATAAGMPGGHLEPGDGQGAVTCEACHGSGAEHAAKDGRVPLADPKASCIRCHTPEMSPEFEFDAAWPRIQHGR